MKKIIIHVYILLFIYIYLSYFNTLNTNIQFVMKTDLCYSIMLAFERDSSFFVEHPIYFQSLLSSKIWKKKIKNIAFYFNMYFCQLSI